MKKNVFKVMFSLAVLSATFVSCSEDDDSSSVNNNNNNGNGNDITNAVNIAKSGTWRVTSYVDSGNDETTHFANYHFTFGNNNVLTADNTTSDDIYTGTWAVTDSNSSDDDSPGNSDIDFVIGFASPADFADLSDDWDITSVTATTISLKDVSGGNGGTDVLVFQKIN